MQLGAILAVLAGLAAAACAHPPSVLEDTRYTRAVHRGPDGQIKRSEAVLAAFRRQWPCPATGRTTGPCGGWFIDHVVPLACGGVDAVYNLQWLPAALKLAPDGKDGFERRVYGGNGMSKGCP